MGHIQKFLHVLKFSIKRRKLGRSSAHVQFRPYTVYLVYGVRKEGNGSDWPLGRGLCGQIQFSRRLGRVGLNGRDDATVGHQIRRRSRCFQENLTYKHTPKYH